MSPYYLWLSSPTLISLKGKSVSSRKPNDLQVEYVQVKSAIMEASKQSVLAKKLAGTGLKEATEPLKRIEVEQPQNQEEP